MSTLNLTSDNFDKTIGSGRTLVDFWAGWCMPCRMVAPVIEELAEKYKDSVTVAKVNVDEENTLAARYNVMSIPTVILFKDGIEIKRFVGVQIKEKYEQALDA
jgi:thioredoxin 1